MAKQSRDDLRTSLKKGELAEVYLLHGPEGFLRDSAARAITEVALKDAPLREFNDITISLLQSDINEAIAAAEQMPMMSPRRVVRVTDGGKARGESDREAEQEAMLRYAQRPSPTSVVIIVMDEMDKRFKFTKTMQDLCYSIEFGQLRDEDLRKWARDRFRELGASIDDRTLSRIVALAGSDVRNLTNEVEKLATAALPQGVVTEQLVEQLVPRSREQSNFELTDHLISGNRTRALQVLERALTDGAEPPMLIGLLASNYHKLALARDLMDQGQPAEEVFRAVGWPPFKRDEFLACARRSDSARLARSLQLIAQADVAIKTSLGTPRMQVEMLVCELATPN
jgi:DNA polymerase-3 subunit delta